MCRKIFAALILLTMLASCASRDKLRYFKGIEQAVENDSMTYNSVLKQDDLLYIVVSSPNAEAAVDFNITSFGLAPAGDVSGNASASGSNAGVAQLQYKAYLVDNKGNIDFPILGQLEVGGLTRAEALKLLKKRLKEYINDPTVSMRILNYKVTVQGEVNSPGVFSITTERITLPEALAMAGDLTIYAKRDNVLVIREINGKKSYNWVDITKADFINSPFYYLSQNDLVYVEPNKIKMNTSALSPNIAIVLSSISVLLSVYVIFIRK